LKRDALCILKTLKTTTTNNIDCVIVGAGFSGITIAERLARKKGLKCMIVDKRSHIGGNSYDRIDDAGVLVHQYGPHYFRTNSSQIVDYLSEFTSWRDVQYKILAFDDNRYWNFPVNLNTFEQFLGKPSTSEEMSKWLESNRVPIDSPRNSEEVIVSQIGWELYSKFFRGYTLKQWKRDPRDLDPSVCGRIPIRTNRDDSYLREKFQAIPTDGYTIMMDRMVASCGDMVQIVLNTDFRELLSSLSFRYLIYTGPIDEYYNYCFGRLPYRSLRFEGESFDKRNLQYHHLNSINFPSPFLIPPGFYQPAMQVNYPNEQEFTRIVEIKHATGQQCHNTTIMREYPEDFGPGKEPYYPIPAADSMKVYNQYKMLTEENPWPVHLKGLVQEGAKNVVVHFTGRLALYRYLNMDEVVLMALKLAEDRSFSQLNN
jgi:UDP-galactopyranose mutase